MYLKDSETAFLTKNIANLGGNIDYSDVNFCFQNQFPSRLTLILDSCLLSNPQDHCNC